MIYEFTSGLSKTVCLLPTYLREFFQSNLVDLSPTYFKLSTNPNFILKSNNLFVM